MDNPTRSERSRHTAVQAAFAILAREGPGALTFDSLARESGISKGGLLHQFRTKSGILKALLEHQMAYYDEFALRFEAGAAVPPAEPTLTTHIATAQEAMRQPQSVALAMLAALVEDPDLLAAPREIDRKKIKSIKAEAADPELALLRWSAARGLVFSALLGLCPLSEKERNRLFECLLDEARWSPKAGKGKSR